MQTGSLELNSGGHPISINSDAPYVFVGASWSDTPFYRINTANHSNPTVENEFFDPHTFYHAYHHGDYLYASSSDEILVYDISSTPEDPVLVHRYPISTFILRMFVKDGRLYALGTGRLYILDASNPEQLSLISGTYSFAGNWGNEFFVYDDQVYISFGGSGGSMEIVDVTDPVNPLRAGVYQLPGQGWDVFVRGGSTQAFVVYGTEDAAHGFQVIDMSDPGNPQTLSTTPTQGQPLCLWVEQDVAYAGSNQSDGENYRYFLEVFDVSDPSNPLRIDFQEGDGAIWDVASENGIIYTAVQGGSVNVFRFADQILSQIGSSHSPSSVGLAMTGSDELGQSTIYTPEGYGYPPGKDGTPDEGIVTTTATHIIQCGLTAFVSPVPEAGTVTPKSKVCKCGEEQVTFKAEPAEGWSFLSWSPQPPHTCPNSGIQVVTANFTPRLTVSGSLDTFYCATMEYDPVPVYDFTLTAGDPDDWELTSLEIHRKREG